MSTPLLSKKEGIWKNHGKQMQEFLSFYVWVRVHAVAGSTTWNYSLDTQAQSLCFQICIRKRWSKCILGQLCTRGALVELFTLITFPLMLPTSPNLRGPLPEPLAFPDVVLVCQVGDEGEGEVVVRADKANKTNAYSK